MKEVVIGTVAFLFLLAGCGQKKNLRTTKDTTTEARSTLPVLENAGNITVTRARTH